MKSAPTILLFSTLFLAAACSDSDDNGLVPGGTGASSSTGGSTGSGGAGQGGQIGACGEGCNVLCTPTSANPSGGACVTVGGANRCHPLTGQGCSIGRGDACDFGPSGFICYPGPNESAICDGCGTSGSRCATGSTCVKGVCAKFCCQSADCGSGGTCTPSQLGVGYCTRGGSTGGGAGGTGGSPAGGNGSGAGGAAAGGAGGAAGGAGGAGGAAAGGAGGA